MNEGEYAQRMEKLITEFYRERSEAAGLKPAIGYLRTSPGGSVTMSTLEGEAEDRGYFICEWVVDQDVSGNVHPLNRAALGPWLGDNPPRPFKAIVAHTARLARRVSHRKDLDQWAERQGVEIIEIDPEPQD